MLKDTHTQCLEERKCSIMEHFRREVRASRGHGKSCACAKQFLCALSHHRLLRTRRFLAKCPHIPPHQSSKLAMVCVLCRYCQGSGEATYLFPLSLSPQKTSKVRSISLVPKPRPLPSQRRGLETRLMQHNIVCCNVKFKPLKNSVADSLWLERLTRVKFCLANTLVSMQVRKVF